MNLKRTPPEIHLAMPWVFELTLAFFAFAIYLVSPVMYISDSSYSMLMAESLLHHRTPDLSAYTIPDFDPDQPFGTRRNLSAYQLQANNGRILYGFPHGSSFLSMPFVAIFGLLGISAATSDNRFDPVGEVAIQKILAAALMTAFVVISFRMASLILDWKWSLIIAAATGFGTPVCSTGSRGLWSHDWEIVLGVIAAFVLLKSVIRETSVRPVLLATLLAWSYFARPTAAIVALAVTIYVLIYQREEFVLLAGTGIAWLLVFTGYTVHEFGTFFPVYFGYQRWTPAELPTAIYGNLFGPARGLFVYTPVLVLVFYWVARYWPAIPSRPLAVTCLVILAGITFVASANRVWWGGACFGPRYLIDAMPWLVLLSVLGVAAIPPECRKLTYPSVISASIALTLSIAINLEAGWSTKAFQWNFEGPYPAVMLDWSRPQFLAPWMNL